MLVCSVGRTGSLSYCQSILIIVLGTCDPEKCRMRCLLKISPELPIELCNRFWRRHKTMVSRRSYLDKVVKGVGVKRRKPGTDPTKSISYHYRLYPGKRKTQVSTHLSYTSLKLSSFCTLDSCYSDPAASTISHRINGFWRSVRRCSSRRWT